MTIVRKRMFRFGDTTITKGSPPLLIAETGMAHNNDWDRAKALIDQTKASGFHVFKTQIYNTERLYSPSSPDYKAAVAREPDTDTLKRMRDYCLDKRIPFCISAHDSESLSYAVENLEPDILKVGSGEWRNWYLLNQAVASGLPLIISTGLYDPTELKKLASIASGCPNLAVLHCVTRYPHTLPEANLYRMQILAQYFPDTILGFSDHSKTQQYLAAFLSVAMGAKIIERHCDLRENTSPGRDRQVSVCSEESMYYMAETIKNIDKACFGRFPTMKERIESNLWARKSPYATRDIPSGDLIDTSDYELLRPGGDLTPDALLIPRRAHLYIPKGTQITEEHLVPLKDNV